MLEILQQRDRELGVRIEFETEAEPDPANYPDADLIVASDGHNSRVRNARPEALQVEVDLRANKYVWLGTRRTFDAFTFDFQETVAGWV